MTVETALSPRAKQRQSERAAKLSQEVIRYICFEGYFLFVKREVNACSLVCKGWREALSGFPVDDVLWRDCKWVAKNFSGNNYFWHLRTLRLTSSNPAEPLPTPQAQLHRLQPEMDCPLLGIRHALKNVIHLNLTHELCLESSLTSLMICTNLQELQLGNVARHENLDFLQNCSRLKSLRIFQADNLKDISILGHSCCELQHLVLRNCIHLTNLQGLRRCRTLETIDLTGSERLESIEALSTAFKLRKLVLTRCLALESIEPLQNCTSLETLYLSHCVLIDDLQPLKAMTQLTTLWLTNCESVRDLTPLLTCVSLRTLSIGNCPQLFREEKLEPLVSLAHLSELFAGGLNPGAIPHRLSRGLYISTDQTIYRCSILARFGTRNQNMAY